MIDIYAKTTAEFKLFTDVSPTNFNIEEPKMCKKKVTELSLYKQIRNLNIEVNKVDKDKIYLCVPFIHLDDFFYNLDFGEGFFDDGGLESYIYNGYVVINAIDICNYFNLNPDNIFEEEL